MRLSGRDWGLAAATVLFAAAVCFIPPSLLHSQDYVSFYKANFRFLLDALHEGRLPLWNPYIGLGRPYLADLQTAVFYPPLYLICLGESIGIFALVAAHCLLAVFGMRALADVLKIGGTEGRFVAFCFLASGALTGRWMSGQILYACGLCYVPILFWCSARTDEAWNGRRIALHAALLALQFLCGHPQVFWFTALGQAAFVIGRSLGTSTRQSLRSAGGSLLQLGTAGLWCVGVAAVSLLPFMELVSEGNRPGTSLAFSNFERMRWEHFASLFRPLSPEFRVNWEMNIFIGLLVAVVGLLGLLGFRERNARGLLVVLIVAFVISIGESSPLYKACFDWLPGFSLFRIHARAAMLIAFVLICVAGIWLSRPHPRLRALRDANVGVATRHFVTALMLLQLGDMLHATWRAKRTYDFNPALSPAAPNFDWQWTLVAKLKETGLLESSRPPPRVCVSQVLIPANQAMIHRYGTFDAYTSLFLQRPWHYLHARLNIQPEEFENTYVSLRIFERGPFPYPELDVAVGLDGIVGSMHVATNIEPRAFLVYAARLAGGASSAVSQMTQGHDIRLAALLEAPLGDPLPPVSSLPSTGAAIRQFEPNSITLDVDARDKALLVLREAWYPGWRAEVDGQAAPVVPVNGWMRAIPVPSGRHHVRVFFRQNYLLVGFLISAACGAWLLLTLCRAPRPRIDEGDEGHARIGTVHQEEVSCKVSANESPGHR